MNRTMKLHLLNFKRTYSYAALFIYGIIALFWLIAYLVDGPEFVSIMTTQPTWLAIITLILQPFTILGLLYPIFDGLVFFDTSLRFGVSRQSYFITQIVTYVFLTLLLVMGNALSEIPWVGSTESYFFLLTEVYLSFSNIAFEFILILGIAILMLAVYRFKAKALIPLVFVGPILGIVIGASFSATENTFKVGQIINIIEFIMNNTELFMSMVITVLIGIYYLMVSKIEVQD